MREAMSPTRNGVAHAGTGGMSALAAAYLANQYGIDPLIAGAIVGMLTGGIGTAGAWAREKQAAGDKRLLIALLGAFG